MACWIAFITRSTSSAASRRNEKPAPPLLFGQFPFPQKLFADSAYQGPIFDTALAKILPCLETEIVKRSDQAKGFVPLPERWIVERTIAWLNRCRRLAKDWENLNRSALAFLKLASIRLMLRKLCTPQRSLGTDS
jgi:putative transposase